MENIRREKALGRAQEAIREDEKLVLLFGFERLLVVAGSQVVARPGGAVALSHSRILLAQEDDSYTYTSLKHSTVLGAQLQTKLLKPSVLTINAGPMGIVAVTGARRDMKHLANGINLFAGRPDPEQPVSRLVPLPTSRIHTLWCSECHCWQQDGWNSAPDYCHGCLRTFEWSDRHRKLVAEYQACLDAGADRMPAHLWEWTKKENPDFARELRG